MAHATDHGEGRIQERKCGNKKREQDDREARDIRTIEIESQQRQHQPEKGCSRIAQES